MTEADLNSTAAEETSVPQAAGNRPTAPLLRPLIYSLILASAAAQFAIVPIMPSYAHRLGLSGLQQGMVLGATGLAALAVSCRPGRCPTASVRDGSRYGRA